MANAKRTIKRPAQTDFQRAVLAAIEQRGITRYKLAQMCGLRPKSIYQMLDHGTSVQNMQRMCDVLGLAVAYRAGAIRVSPAVKPRK